MPAFAPLSHILWQQEPEDMAVPASKRRKVEHVWREDDDSASFTSFSGSNDQDRAASEASQDQKEVVGNVFQDREEAVGENADDVLDEEDQQDGGSAAASVDYELEAKETNGDLRGHADKPPAGPSGAHSRNASKRPIKDPGLTAYSAGTFKNNIFKLQVDDLLDQVRPRQGARDAAAEGALHELKLVIEQIPARGPTSIHEAEHSLLLQKITIPWPDARPSKDAKYKLEYAKPANINVVGSYPLKTAPRAKHELEVDMAVQMPASLLQEKDYLNHRYFHKRAFCVACIAAGLKAWGRTDFELRYRSFHDDILKPVLVVTLRRPSAIGVETKPALQWQINILVSIEPDALDADRLAPWKNCIRIPPAAHGVTENQSEPKPAATPLYNSSLRADMLVTSYLRLLHGAASSCAAFRDACLLGSTWLRQRGFGSSISSGGFGTFEWSALMALLLQGGGPSGRPLLNEGYSSYQLLKATIQLIASKDFSKQPLVVCEQGDAPSSLGDGMPTVWDGRREHNLLYKATPWAYRQLRQEAHTTLNILGDQLFDGFESTFVLRTDQSLLQNDFLVQVNRTYLHDQTRDGNGRLLQPQKRLYDVFTRGLGDRVNRISISVSKTEPWDLDSERSNTRSKGSLTIGIAVNPETVNRTVDHGPSAESKSEAAAFRKFWGEKAELRRFKDGSILESLIWSAREGGRSILEQIVRYLVGKHFGEAAGKDAVFIGDGFSRMLRHSSGLTPFQPLMEAYKQMESDIRNLEGLPLAIRQVMPADSQLRYASVQASSARSLNQMPTPASVTIQFEGSGRWPDDLVAIQRTKIAFLLKLSQLLKDSVNTVTTQIGLENAEYDILNQAYLDVIYDSGTAFRLRIHHDREQTLLERRLKDKSLDPNSKETAALGLATYKRDFVKAPAHTQAIARLCSHYPALSGTVRLVKKWFASHLLANHFADELIELVVARTFVQPWPWQTPSSVQTGFLRTLHWLSRWDWRPDPLIVDLSGSGELKQAEVQAMRTRFEAWRKVDPALNRVVLFAASSADQEGSTWTNGRPAKVIVGRMTALARAACVEIKAKGVELEPASLFVSPLSDYDFVIYLNGEMPGSKRMKHAKNGTFKNLELDTLSDASLIGFNPTAEFLQELQEIYGSAMLFFHGSERPFIAGLWSPQTAPRSWKVNLAYSTLPIRNQKGDEVEARMNIGAVLAEIARLGGDLVERIEVNR